MVRELRSQRVKKQWYILTPETPFMRWVWAPMSYAIVMYSITFIPFAVSFEEWYEGLNAEACCNTGYYAFICVDAIFILDWVLGFFTAFQYTTQEWVVWYLTSTTSARW